MPTVALCPVLNSGTQFTNLGKPLAGGKISFYQAGSNSILQNTYTTNAGTVANSNPIPLDASGRLQTNIWLDTSLTYNIVLYQPDGTTVLETHDYISGAVTKSYVDALIAGLSGQFLPITGGGITGNLSVLGTTSLKNTAVTGTFSVTGTSSLGVTTATSLTGSLNANSNKITNVATPTTSTDAATKSYVDSAIGDSGLPSGIVTYTAAASAPTGWLIADGSSVSRTTYASLFAAIGTVYGSLDINSFNLPDLRGYFIRGLDLSRGVDTGRSLGSNQTGTVQAHQHVGAWGEAGSGTFGQTTRASYAGSNATDFDNKLFFTNNGTNFDGLDNGGVIGTETRPVNIALVGIIKI